MEYVNSLRVSNLYNVAQRAAQTDKTMDVPIASIGHARLVYRVKDNKITLMLLKSRQKPMEVNAENLTYLQFGNIHNKERVETLQLAYSLANNK